MTNLRVHFFRYPYSNVLSRDPRLFRLPYNECTDNLAIFRVRYSYDGGLADGRIEMQSVLNLNREQVLRKIHEHAVSTSCTA